MIQTEDTKQTKVGVKQLNIKEIEMANEQNYVVDRLGKALRDNVAPIFNENMSSILRPIMTANNFEIKLTLITMIQTSIYFRGHINDNPHAHINNLLEIYDTLKINGVVDNAIRLRLFPFPL